MLFYFGSFESEGVDMDHYAKSQPNQDGKMTAEFKTPWISQKLRFFQQT